MVTNLMSSFPIDHDMDGEAISTALGTKSGPDCLKDVLPKLGQRLKVYKALQEHIKVLFVYLPSASLILYFLSQADSEENQEPQYDDEVLETLAHKRRTSPSDTISVSSSRSGSEDHYGLSTSFSVRYTLIN